MLWGKKAKLDAVEEEKEKTKHIYTQLGAGDEAQERSICLACAKPWLQAQRMQRENVEAQAVECAGN